MGVDIEPGVLGNAAQGTVETALGSGVQGEVGNRAAARADEVVVVLGEVLGELVASEVVASHDAGDGIGRFQDGEVPVDTGLGECLVGGEDLGDGQRPVAGLEDRDQPASTGGVALVVTAEEGSDFVVDVVVGHHSQPI